MILTLKREHNLIIDEENNIELFNFLKQANIVKRCAFNYFKKNPDNSLSDCEKYIKTLNNIELVNASWIKSITNSMKNIDEVEDNLFGSRYLMEKLSKKEYKNETERLSILNKYRYSRNTQYISMRGSTSDSNTNRCGKLYFDEGYLHVEFFINKDNKYHFILNDVERNQLKDIKMLVELIEQKKAYFNIGINSENIYVSYDNYLLHEKVEGLIKNRVLTMDLNPYEIGMVIMEKGRSDLIDEIVYKIDELIKNRNANKTDNELSMLGLIIVQTAIHYKCSKVILEKLTLKNSEVPLFNEWNVKDIRDSIQKWCDYYGIKFSQENAFYSTFMGQLLNPGKLDCIASSVELGIRSFIGNKELVWERINKFLSGYVLIKDLPNRWKKEVDCMKRYIGKAGLTLKELYLVLKSNKNKYYRVRVRFSDFEKQFTGFSLKSDKSLIKVYDVKRHHFI